MLAHRMPNRHFQRYRYAGYQLTLITNKHISSEEALQSHGVPLPSLIIEYVESLILRYHSNEILSIIRPHGRGEVWGWNVLHGCHILKTRSLSLAHLAC